MVFRKIVALFWFVGCCVGAGSALAEQIDVNALLKRTRQLSLEGSYVAALAEAKKLESASRAAFGANHPAYAVALFALADVYRGKGELRQAETLYRNVLAIELKSFGPNHPELASTYTNLAVTLSNQNRNAEAEEYFREAVILKERSLGTGHLDIAVERSNLALILQKQGKYSDAADQCRQALEIRERALGPDHLVVSRSLANLAEVYSLMGKSQDARALYQRALAVRERLHGPRDPAAVALVHNLAETYREEGENREAEALYRRALASYETMRDANALDLSNTINGLALVLASEGKYDEAEALHRRTLAIRERVLGDNHPLFAAALSNLAMLYEKRRSAVAAEQLYRRALAIDEQAFGRRHIELTGILNNLAGVYADAGRHVEAEEQYRRALAIREEVLGAEHPSVVQSLYNLSILFGSTDRPAEALAYSRRAVALILANEKNEREDPSLRNAGSLIERRSNYFRSYLVSLALANRLGLEPAEKLAREAFEIAQWAGQSSAAVAIQLVSSRFSTGSDALAKLVREDQDLTKTWRDKDKLLVAALSKPEAQQDRPATDGLRKQISSVEIRRNEIAAEIAGQFPGYAALVRPNPTKTEEVQNLLRKDEALIFFLLDSKQSYVFAVSRDRFDWEVIPIGANELADKVSAFRRRLDASSAANTEGTTSRSDLFDLALANELYATLFGSIEGLIGEKKQLLIVPTGALTALPFHLLVTEKPTSPVPESMAGYRDAAWLIKRQAVTVLPSVSSLRALRVLAQHSQQAPKSMIGFGDPVFKPEPEPTVVAPKAPPAPVKAKTRPKAAKTRAYADYWRGAELDREQLWTLERLPDTAVELKSVGKDLGAAADDIYLGKLANETTVKHVALKDYRVVYFATHGLIAGDIKGISEPSLALSLPERPTELDDGLLTSSEVAQLKLNADWVVLSACNTMAGDKPGAEAMSGLARAFFYAGARSLLVTHWAVDSAAATRLTTSTFDLMKKDPAVGRAEALRQAMLAFLNDESSPDNANPALWGPFAIIGEGAARRN